MTERFVINRETHMGPICRNLRAGDVVAWDNEQETLSINGMELRDDGRGRGSKTGFPELARILRELSKKDEENRICDALPERKGEPSSVNIGTDTLVVFPILGCFRASEDWLGEEQMWTPVTELQSHFLENFIEHMRQADVLGGNLRRRADNNVEVINSWLKENGFDIHLNPAGGNSFYVASILDVLVEWLKEGRKTRIQNAKGEFEAVRLGEGVAAYMNEEIHPYPVVKILTKSGDVLCMSICGRLPDDKFAIHWKIEQLRAIQTPYPVEGVVFPMVNYNKQVDISWLRGLRTSPNADYWEVAEAVQQTKFRMNEIGARAQSAVAMSLRCCADAEERPWAVIDKPFILWIERKGIVMPLFAGTFAEDVWKNPGSLA